MALLVPSWSRTVETAVRVAMVALIAIVLFRFGDYHTAAEQARQRFRAANGNYDLLRAADPAMHAGLIARMVIPPDQPWAFSEVNGWTKIRLRYVMYPNTRIEPDSWAYFIDLGGKFSAPPVNGQQVVIPGVCAIYAQPGHAFLPAPPPPAEYPLGRSITAAAGIAAAYVLGGLALLSACAAPVAPLGRLGYLGLAYLAGLTVHGLVTWLLLLCGIPFGGLASIAAWAIPAGTAAYVGRDQLRAIVGEFRPRLPEPGGRFDAAIVLAAALFTGWLAVQYVTPFVLSPAMSWDAQSHWVIKAAALLHHRTLAFAADTHHNGYPILWPITVATQFLFAGGAHDELAQWSQALLVFALIAALHGGLGLLGLPPRWRWGLLPLFLVFFQDESLTWAYAEGLLTANLAALCACTAAVLRGAAPGRWLVLAFVFAAGVTLSKLEGGLACVIAAAAAAAAHDRFLLERRAWVAGLVLAVPLALTILWNIYQSRHGYLSMSHFRESATLGKARFILWRVIEDAKGRGMGWRVAAGMGLFAALRYRERWGAAERFLGLTALGLILFTAAGLLGWRTDDLEQETLTATPRLMLHAAPALFLLIARLVYAETTPAVAQENPAT